MAKWMWFALMGGVVTYFIHRTKSSYTWMAAGLTALISFWLWKQG